MFPTDLMNTSLFGTVDDNSSNTTARYYKTSSNLPWAVNFATHFNYPVEKAPIISAYLKFAAWAQSNESLYNDWYSNSSTDYRVNSNIYK